MSQDNENSLRFPLNVEDRPFVRFLIRTRVAKTGKMDMGSSKSINLFLPMDFQIADGASYDSINLGAIKAFEENRQTEEQVRENVKGKDRESIAIAAAVLNQMTGGTLEGATQVGLVTNNVAVNNMSTATFNDMQIRNFNFNFQLMPTTEKESDIIRKIENTFRKFMYPRKIGTGFALEYPPLFRISFHTPDGKINIGTINLETLDNCKIGLTTPSLATFTDLSASTIHSSGNVDISGNVDLDGTLDVSGAATLKDTLTVTGAVAFKNTLALYL